MKKRILFVEDNEKLLELYAIMAGRIDMNAVGTFIANGQEALDRVLAAPDSFDLIVTDNTLPGLNGLELSKKIKSLHPTIPIIMVSADEIPQNERTHLKSFLQKPVAFKILREAILS